MTAKLLILLVRAYQVVLSPFLGGACRFLPSCSAYAIEALATHGAWRGSLLALGRLSRCHPLARAGADPVPSPAAYQPRRRTPNPEPRISEVAE